MSQTPRLGLAHGESTQYDNSFDPYSPNPLLHNTTNVRPVEVLPCPGGSSTMKSAVSSHNFQQMPVGPPPVSSKLNFDFPNVSTRNLVNGNIRQEQSNGFASSSSSRRDSPSPSILKLTSQNSSGSSGASTSLGMNEGSARPTGNMSIQQVGQSTQSTSQTSLDPLISTSTVGNSISPNLNLGDSQQSLIFNPTSKNPPSSQLAIDKTASKPIYSESCSVFPTVSRNVSPLQTQPPSCVGSSTISTNFSQNTFCSPVSHTRVSTTHNKTDLYPSSSYAASFQSPSEAFAGHSHPVAEPTVNSSLHSVGMVDPIQKISLPPSLVSSPMSSSAIGSIPMVTSSMLNRSIPPSPVDTRFTPSSLLATRPMQASSVVARPMFSSPMGSRPIPPSSMGTRSIPPSLMGSRPIPPSLTGNRPIPPSVMGTRPMPTSPMGTRPIPPSPMGTTPILPSPMGTRPMPPSSMGTRLISPSSIGSRPMHPSSIGNSPMHPSSIGSSPMPPSSIGNIPMHPMSIGTRPMHPTSIGTSSIPMGSIPPTSVSFNKMLQQPPISPYVATSSASNYAVTSQPYNANHVMASKPTYQQLSQQFSGMSVTHDGWNKGWGTTPLDLLQHRQILPSEGVVPPKPPLLQENLANCHSDIFRCTLTRIPETNSVLQKSRLPFGILIHPYKDLEHLPVVNASTIVRCRSCRTYINPFIVFKSDRRWECNLCFKVNELPEEFHYDPVCTIGPDDSPYSFDLTRTYGDPSRRPEVREATIEFIAPAEYMLRPPQPAAYIYVLDVSSQAVDTGYLSILCKSILEHIDDIPGDRRMLLGFITYSATLQFYLLGEEQNNPCMLEVGALNEVFLPCPQDLLVNAEDCRPLIEEFLNTLPETHANTTHTESCLGAALLAAYKLLSPIGGRITVVANTLPTIGPGSLKPREDPNQRSAKEISHLGPATDFYKKFALDCSGQQIACDLFTINSQYIDLATLSGISKFSGGCIYHFPNFNVAKNNVATQSLVACLSRYLTRKIGLEAVMRIRATRGLAVTNFHGNFFVRSTDLLSLPNVNPDSGFGMQVTVEENLHNIRYACFQAALLYTSSKGERRIRVHTMCLPVTGNVHEVITSVDQQCMVGFLSKLAVDRCLTSQMSDAREAVVNACVDSICAYKNAQSIGAGGIPVAQTMMLVPLYCLALLKSVALRYGVCTKLDDRVFSMCEMKTMPLNQIMTVLYPDLFPIHDINEQRMLNIDGITIPQPARLHLSAEFLDKTGAYFMDAGSVILIYVRSHVDPSWINDVIGVPNYAAIPQPLNENPVPTLDNRRSELIRNFLNFRQRMKPYVVPVRVIKEENTERHSFTQRLVDDRSEGTHSYIEFLQYIRSLMK